MIFQFDRYTLDKDRLELRRGEEAIDLEPQVFSVLTYLVENRDQVVSKEELIDAVWDGRIVSDSALNSRINSVRRAVGDDGKTQSVIRTLPRRGFRFVADVTEDEKGSSPPLDVVPEIVTVEEESQDRVYSGRPSIVVVPFENMSSDPNRNTSQTGSPRTSLPLSPSTVGSLLSRAIPAFFIREEPWISDAWRMSWV